MVCVTNPTNAELDRIMAEHMGWHKGPNIGLKIDGAYFIDGEGNALIPVREWHPSSDMNQAMMCAKVLIDRKRIMLKIEVDPVGTSARFLDKYDVPHWLTDKSTARAICLAIWRAKEVENG